jgi:hypothetical protein
LELYGNSYNKCRSRKITNEMRTIEERDGLFINMMAPLSINYIVQKESPDHINIKITKYM